jgi:hypothetical protein
MLIRLPLMIAGGIAALFVARDAPNFQVVEGMFALAVIAVVVLALALMRRR